jgi:hypothetical protein
MSGLGAEHVQEMPLKSGIEAGYAWLTREKAERPDISGLGAGHVRPESLESGKGPYMSGLTGVFASRIDF